MRKYYDRDSNCEVDFDFYDKIEPEPESSLSYDSREDLLGVLFIFIDYLIMASTNSMLRERVIYLAYVLGHPSYRGFSEEDLAFRIGKTRACVSSNVLAIQRMLGIPPGPGQKSVESRRVYHNVPRGTKKTNK